MVWKRPTTGASESTSTHGPMRTTHLIAFLLGCTFVWAIHPATAREAAPSTIVSLDDAPYRRAPSDSAGIAILARGANAFIGRLDMEAGGGVPEHQDPTEEYIHVLQGTGQITVDGVTTDLRPGHTVFMPAGATVSFTNGPAPLVALQVFAGPASADKFEAWPLSDQSKRHR